MTVLELRRLLVICRIRHPTLIESTSVRYDRLAQISRNLYGTHLLSRLGLIEQSQIVNILQVLGVNVELVEAPEYSRLRLID